MKNKAKDKAEASDALVKFSEWLKNITGFCPRRWRLDGGQEFGKFITWAEYRGITFEPTPPRTPDSERYATNLNQTSHVILLDAGLPAELWPFSIETAVYIINRLIAPNKPKSPLQLSLDSFSSFSQQQSFSG